MSTRRGRSAVEDVIENVLIFGSRWVLLPGYAMLALSLIVLSLMSIFEFVQLVMQLRIYDEANAIAQVLVIVDLVLVMNLVLMILFVGYVNFISVIHPKNPEDWPRWMGTLDYSGLKTQVLGSIIAISAVKLLHSFLDIGANTKVEQDRLLWMTIILAVFVLSVLVLAVSNKLHVRADEESMRRFSGEISSAE